MPQQGFNLGGHKGDFRIGKETAFVQRAPCCLDWPLEDPDTSPLLT